MRNWTQEDLFPHMKVYTFDEAPVGHVVEMYADSFLVHQGYFFPKDRYIPYSAIADIEEHRLQLTLNVAEFNDPQWEKRPDYDRHLGDPTQLLYDRGHGIHDPFDDTQPGM